MRNRRVVAIVTALVGVFAAIVTTSVAANAAQGDYFEIVNSISGKCADLRLGSTAPYTLLEQQECSNSDKQLWQPVSLGNGYLKYVNKASGLCMNVRGSLVDIQDCDASRPSQWWRWLGADEIGHLVLNSGVGNYCLALQGVYSARNGWTIVINECATTSGQMWHPA